MVCKDEDTVKAPGIVIVGGVAGGATASGRARRLSETAEITVLERGPEISFANCGLPYYIGGDIKDRNALLLRKPQDFMDRYRVKVLTQALVHSIDRENKKVLYTHEGQEKVLQYDKLILSQGANPLVPEFTGSENIRHYSLRTLDDMDSIYRKAVEGKARSAIVVGAGFIGLEMAEALTQRGLKVYLLEMANQIMTPVDPEFALMATETLNQNGIEIITGTSIREVTRNREIILSNGNTLNADFILFSVGVKPETSLAMESGLKIGTTGAVAVNEFLQSSDPDIYVIGDMAEITHRISGQKTKIPLAGPANRQGRIAAENALGGNTKYAGAMGTSIVKIFDKTLATTGLNEKIASGTKLKYNVAFTHNNNHAGYYPEAGRISLKVLYETKTGRILGAQAFGAPGTDKRIDVIATAIAGNLTMNDLASLDLSYAPPYSSANDPVNVSGFIAQNEVENMAQNLSILQLQNFKLPYKILDVRNESEISQGGISGAIKIPLNELRNRMRELDKKATYMVLCQSGQRSYIAIRILKQNGFANAYNLAGGYNTFRYWNI